MKLVTIRIGDDDIRDIERIFENEAEFNPMTREDVLLIEIIRQVKDNPKVEASDGIDV